jgi:hypothetical protein
LHQSEAGIDLAMIETIFNTIGKVVKYANEQEVLKTDITFD